MEASVCTAVGARATLRGGERRALSRYTARVLRVRRALVGALSLVLLRCSAPTQPPVEDAVARDSTDDRALDDRRAPATTSPYPAANVTVTLPYEGPEVPVDLEFTAGPGRVDVHLLIDTTASFDGEIRELQNALSTVTLPALERRVPSITLGLSRFEDMPWMPFGTTTDRPFALIVPQTTQLAVVNRALFRLDDPLGSGGDGPESWIEALYQVATGEGINLGAYGAVPPFSGGAAGGGTLGGVGFRSNATRVVVLVTDAPSHDGSEYRAVVPTAHTGSQAIAALQSMQTRVVGIVSGAAARPSLESVAMQTGAVALSPGGFCATGLNGAARTAVSGRCPLVYEIAADGTGLSRTVADGIGAVLDTLAFSEMHGEARDDSMRFVRAIEARSATPPANTAAPTVSDALPAMMPDGVQDTFNTVRAGTTLRFRARLANRTVRDGLYPQVFFLKIVLLGDGLEQRETSVRVIVPEGPKLDAGVEDASVPGDSGPDADGSMADAGEDVLGPDATEMSDAGTMDRSDDSDR